MVKRGFVCGSMVKNLPANAGDTGDRGSVPGSGRSPGVGNGNSLQYSCLKNPMDRGALWLQSMGSQESGTTEHAHLMVTTEMKDGQKPSSVTAQEHLHTPSMCPLSRQPPRLHMCSCQNYCSTD